MSKFADLTQHSFRPNIVRVPIFFALIVASVLSLWFAMVPRAEAANNCDLCHKRVDTITVVCFGLDWRRHKDHGDTDGACGATTPNAFLKPAHKKVSPNKPNKD